MKKKYVALVCFRSGSKGIKNKNIIKFKNKPLYYWTLKNSTDLNLKTIVSTDYNKSDLKYLNEKILFVKRPKYLAQDNSKIEEVIKHLILNSNLNNINCILLQVTSPLRNTLDIQKCINLYEENNFDLVTTVTKTKNTVLKYGFVNKNIFTSVNNQNFCFSNRQDLPNLYALTGSIYVFNSNWFLKNNGFLNSKIGVIETTNKTSLDIDNKSDYINLKNHEN